MCDLKIILCITIASTSGTQIIENKSVNPIIENITAESILNTTNSMVSNDETPINLQQIVIDDQQNSSMAPPLDIPPEVFVVKADITRQTDELFYM